MTQCGIGQTDPPHLASLVTLLERWLCPKSQDGNTFPIFHNLLGFCCCFIGRVLIPFFFILAEVPMDNAHNMWWENRRNRSFVPLAKKSQADCCHLRPDDIFLRVSVDSKSATQ